MTLARLRDLVFSEEAERFRGEACRGAVALPYASNRYVRLLDDLRRLLDAAPRSRATGQRPDTAIPGPAEAEVLAEALAAHEWPDLTWAWITEHCDAETFRDRARHLIALGWTRQPVPVAAARATAQS